MTLCQAEAAKRRAAKRRLLKLITSVGIDEMALDEKVIDCKCSEAAAINNEGFEAQLQYLIDSGVSEEDIRQAIEEAKDI